MNYFCAVALFATIYLAVMHSSADAQEAGGPVQVVDGGGEAAAVAPEPFSYPGVVPEVGGTAPLMEKARKSKINVVTWPGFQMMPSGEGSRVFVQILKGAKKELVGEPVRVEKPPFKTAPRTLVYLFPESCILLRNNLNPLISKYFNTPVEKARMKRFKKKIYLIIELRVDVLPARERFVKAGDDLYFFFVEFESGSYLPKG